MAHTPLLLTHTLVQMMLQRDFRCTREPQSFEVQMDEPDLIKCKSVKGSLRLAAPIGTSFVSCLDRPQLASDLSFLTFAFYGFGLLTPKIVQASLLNVYGCMNILGYVIYLYIKYVFIIYFTESLMYVAKVYGAGEKNGI